ncbi:MAG: FtsW/RodA/SpoVE family cell cycle protein [Patescibacteria group bacterium]
MSGIMRIAYGIDWISYSIIAIIAMWGLLVLYSFDSPVDALFDKQVLLLGIAFSVMTLASFFNYRFLRKSWVVMSLYAGIVGVLGLLSIYGSVFSGAQSWFSFGSFALQPAEFAKVVLIIVLAKYFSRRHIEIKALRHLIISGMYTLVLFILVASQPDFGSAVILFLIWFGMVLLSGINYKQVLLLVGSGLVALLILWIFVFSPYQKERIESFIDPGADIRGAGYNALQATIAVGSGGLWGKGVGYGSQSRLQFLPQYQTDFIIAAFAEEWGFIGMIALLALYATLVYRIARSGMYGETNFEMLFAGGVAIYFTAHIVVHTGINIGLLPVTGITIPFMSYGGSHLVAEALAVGMVFGMRKYNRPVHRQSTHSELYTHS